MIEQDNRKRYRHNEDLLFEELSEAVETIDAVAHATGKPSTKCQAYITRKPSTASLKF